MNSNFYIILIYLSTFLMSCDDKLEVVQEDVLDANIAVTSLEDLEKVLNGAYASLRNEGLYKETMVYLPDLMSDNLRIGNSNTGALRTEANWQYSSGTKIGTWSAAYKLIFRANTVITYEHRFADGGYKNRIVGQAYALRALAHFDLLRYYGQSYNRNSTDLGVPIVTAYKVQKPVRNTVKEVYDQIFKDLLFARTTLGNVDKKIQTNGPYYIDQRAINALLARVALYAEEWQDAVDYASRVISISNLDNITSYPSIWTDDIDGEILFAVKFATTSEGRIGGLLLDNTQPNRPKSNITLTADLAKLYDSVNDIRYQSFVKINPATNAGDDKYLPFKYPGRGGEHGLNNAKVLRTSEMYLIRAEAYTHISGQESKAMDDLNTLRENRIVGYKSENLVGIALADAIRKERRKELAIEGHRWFDLRRIGHDVVRGKDCRGLTVNCTLKAGDYRFVFPIPRSEVLVNPNIIQNKGY